MRFISLLHSLCTKRQVNYGIKARPDVFWDLNITFKCFVCFKKKQSIAMYFFKLKIILDKSGYQK